MVFTVETKLRTSLNGLKKFLKNIEEADKLVVKSGVFGPDKKAVQIAKENEYGEIGIYERGPFAGQSVKRPARPFVRSAIEHHKREIIKAAGESLNLEKENGIVNALDAMGKKTSELQEKTLYSNGEGVPGWQKYNSYRTIVTKGGLDKPLFREDGGTFEITYRIGRKSA